VPSIDDVFLEVESGRAVWGVVPVENSTEGAVNNTLDCLIETSLAIVGEVYLPIEHNLLVRNPAGLSGVRRIVSHKQSLGQCRLWLRSHYPGMELVEVASNAEAARLAAEMIRLQRLLANWLPVSSIWLLRTAVFRTSAITQPGFWYSHAPARVCLRGTTKPPFWYTRKTSPVHCSVCWNRLTVTRSA